MRIPPRAREIMNLIRENEYRKIVEVGVCKGETAMLVILSCDLELYVMVDPAIDNSLNLLEFIESRPYCQILDEKSEEGARWFPDNFFDLVFIDSLHTYEQVMLDCNSWTPKVRAGGMIVVHDYENRRFPGVKEAVDKRYGTGRIRTIPVRMCKLAVIEKWEEGL